MKKIIMIAGIFFIIALNGLFANLPEDSSADRLPARRFGVFIGANNGGRDRIMLRYAVNDARSVSRVFANMGGINNTDNFLLVEPNVREINRHLNNVGRLASQAGQAGQRTELVFYYSGHSDEEGIFLNRERYTYRELRERINSIQADMKIVILDSCSSGAITRIKGGEKMQPFLFDTSISAEGFAILTSSSADEVSQESDSIESSFFTHSLLAGLRGAADSVGDGRVTLNELYRYAYTETLARTETSLYGAQHPSYDIQISGSGDVVLTDIKETSASLYIAEDLTGRISIRDDNDFLVAELTKVGQRPMQLGLEPGQYRIILQQGNNFYRADITLSENRRTTLNMRDFQRIAAASGDRSRGDDLTEDNESEDTLVIPFNLQFIPGFNMFGLFGHSWQKSTSNVLIGVFVGIGHNINGFGAASIGLVNSGNVNGVQTSGIFNFAYGEFNGLQAAGILNIVRNGFSGLQAAGIMNFALGDVNHLQVAGITNIAWGSVKGSQIGGIANFAGEINGLQLSGILNVNNGGKGVMIGLVNISSSEDIVPIGLINITKGGILHPAIYVDDMLFTNLSFRSGGKHFYGIISAGIRDTYIITRGGFGFEIPIQKTFINIDYTFGNFYNFNSLGDNNSYNTLNFQARLTLGYKFLRHLGIFAGISYDYFYRRNDNCADPSIFFNDSNSFMSGSIHGRNFHKLGFFGGIQF